MRTTSRLLTLLPATILVVVALRQIQLARTEELSPWKGGGFGMFSSTDSGPSRRLRVTVEGPDRSERVRVPDELATLALRAKTLPTDRWLREVARKMAASEARAGRPVTHVRVEVWRRQFEPVGLEARETLVRAVDHDLAPTAD